MAIKIGDNSSVLAIGIDSAEPTLVRQLIEQDEMPALSSLLAQGKWSVVRSPAPIGSGAVWPTFLTGADPTVHGIYSEWKWDPECMGLRRYYSHHLTPFWKPLAQQGLSIGVLDIPFSSPVGVSDGFEVCEWWSHDSTTAGLQVSPARIRSLLKETDVHPLALNRFFTSTPANENSLKELTEACIAGVRLRGKLAQRLLHETRPDVSIIVFPELHHAGHQLWHTVAPAHRAYKELQSNGAPKLREVYRAVDQQIGELINSTSAGTIMVFALHGMRPTLGLPSFLGPLLCERGFARLAAWHSQTWANRGQSAFATMKRRTPARLRRLYYEVAPITATYKLARPTMLPVYDWQHTRAFALPTDQYGWIRINLVGRERQGVVRLADYDNLCTELDQTLSALTTEDGEPLVKQIIRTAAESEAVHGNPLPDLVVHWSDAVLAPGMKIRGSKVTPQQVSKKTTGQHASEGFCIYRGTREFPGVVDARQLGELIINCFPR